MGLGHILMQMENDDVFLNGVILTVCIGDGRWTEGTGLGWGTWGLAGLDAGRRTLLITVQS